MDSISNKKQFDKCETSHLNLLRKYNKIFELKRDNHKACLIKCTDKLNFPSEELTCYDKCEEAYNTTIIQIRDDLYEELNKLIT
jgi:hypothetical protein